MGETGKPTRAELLATIAQAMRDANTPDAWVEPQTVPFHHFAEAALLALTGPVKMPAGLDARPTVRWTVHCSHCGAAVVEDGTAMVFSHVELANIRDCDYDVSGWEFDVDGRALVCDGCRVGWCEGCGEDVNPWQPRRVRHGEVWHPACADKPCEPGIRDRQGPGPEFEVPGEPSKTPPAETEMTT